MLFIILSNYSRQNFTQLQVTVDDITIKDAVMEENQLQITVLIISKGRPVSASTMTNALEVNH